MSQLGLSDENGRCGAHDPLRAEVMREGRAKGGRSRKGRTAAAKSTEVPPAPTTLQDAVDWSSWAMRKVATGEIDARTGHEIGYLVNAFKGALEKRDLQKEIEKLRAELDTAQARLRKVPA
jgi:hypothetical protein